MSTRLTEAELARLEKMEAKATQGEWKVSEPAVYIYTADGMVAKMENCPEFKSNSEFIAALRNHAPALIAAARRAAALERVVRRAMEPGVFGPWHVIPDPLLERTNLHELCKEYGYGAVMHYVEYLWKTHGKHPGSEHTCAACADVRRAWQEEALAALDAAGKECRDDCQSRRACAADGLSGQARRRR